MFGNCLPSRELLADLCSRFVLNAPYKANHSFNDIMCMVECAYWYYEDNCLDNDPTLASLPLKDFTSLLFDSCDLLRPYVSRLDDIFKDFTSFKSKVPVTGAIILDDTYQRGWKGSNWTFPRVKMWKSGEEDHACAIREVLDKTGFDISKLLKKEEYIECIQGAKRRLYIVAGVSEDTVFAPLAENKISEITWHRLNAFESEASNEVITHGPTGLKLYMVAPLLESLKTWISNHPSPIPRSMPRKGLALFFPCQKQRFRVLSFICFVYHCACGRVVVVG